MAGRTGGPKTRCSGQWTEAKFKSFVKGNLRSATRKWAPIQSCKQKARTRRGFYRCAGCGEEVPASAKDAGSRTRKSNVHVDHITPIIPVTGWVSWDDCIENMFSEEDNLQLLCTDCHKVVTDEENAQRKSLRKFNKDYPLEYKSWRAMRGRCNNPTNHNYERYGGRGISVYSGWSDFKNFLSDMGERSEGTTLDRIDSDGDYTPENCRWADPKQQARNRCNNTLLEAFGKVLCITEWAERKNINPSTLSKRIHSGWGVESALTIPVKKYKNKREG